MRQFGTLEAEDAANTLVDHLLTLGVEARANEDNGEWALWVYDEDDLHRARLALESFQRHENSAAYQESSAKAAELRENEHRQQRVAAKNFVDVRNRWRQGSVGRAPVTMALIIGSIAVTLLTGFGDSGGALLDLMWINLGAVARGQLWRLFTPVLLHLHPLHLLFNMMWLYFLGRLIEARQGTRFIIVMVLGLAMVSNLAQYFASGPNFAGMSGVVYGLFGYAWMKGRYDPAAGLTLQKNTVIFMMVFFVIGFTGSLGPIANIAHGAGLGGGCLAGAWRHIWRRLS